ncbi:MAG: HAD-IA family hydrolase [Candidatus Lokiarchaeota archaeon]|nr:HAD-IA family hydrolase [Candidatus Lokiarchaeota archaeon]MBD3200066.1 HAD-IA family hydrolase [Candidatus Lokiarchaeota archaeon]
MNLHNRKLLIFDLDGTIVDLHVNWPKLKSLLSEKYSSLYEENCQFTSISGCLSRVVAKNDEEELINFFEMIREFELSYIDKTVPIKETVYFIKHRKDFKIADDIKLAILSLNTRAVIHKALKMANVIDEFDYIVGREDVRAWKPEPEGLLKIKKHYNFKNQEIVFFGDMKKDLLAGKNARIDTYLIDDLIYFINKNKGNSGI